MKKIASYRKLLGVSEKATLQELKTTYRNLMKDWHPDKLVNDHDLKPQAEIKSKQIIEAYHFLVSIAPETKMQNLAEFTAAISAGIIDFEYKSETIQFKFSNGSSYEFFGVPKSIYVKLINAPAQARFARRHIFSSFEYRIAGKVMAE